MFYIPQKPKLLDRTLYENIYYGIDVKDEDKGKNVQKVLGILKSMHLDQTIMDIFMEKMDQKLGNDGIRLSGGQRQMVWIIRAMLRDSKIIIFDEPTSALDQENKSKIVSMIKEIGKNKTILIVSHDNIDSDFRKITMKQGEVLKNENPFQWI
jgi:ABC-type multidrug transport system fused ATPase/permease subunit